MQAVHGTVVSLIQENGAVRGVICRLKDEAELKVTKLTFEAIEVVLFNPFRSTFVEIWFGFRYKYFKCL